MNKTYNALIGRGIDSEKANNVVKKGLTIRDLSSCSQAVLDEIGLSTFELEVILKSSRPAIPEDTVTRLLYKSRSICCICRSENGAIVIHHIKEWNESFSHSEENLVILCLVHHDEAHTKKELSLNLTPDRIRNAKEQWENEVKRQDIYFLAQQYKEHRAITVKLSKLKERWFKFLLNLNMKIEISNTNFYDFKILGLTTLLAKVYEISDINELLNKEVLVKEFEEDSFFDYFIILGNRPFLSNNGFYGNEINIQIGWIYSHGDQNWDHVMLKENYDISNSKFYVENFLYPNTSYKIFLTEEDYPMIESIWSLS